MNRDSAQYEVNNKDRRRLRDAKRASAGGGALRNQSDASDERSSAGDERSDDRIAEPVESPQA
jgi:hypothetical protein